MRNHKLSLVLFATLSALFLFLASAASAFAAATEQVLYNFCSANNCADGSEPHAGLIFDAAGNLYGTASGGAYANGAIFELTPGGGGAWTETVLYNFCSLSGCADGAGPAWSSLIFDAAGNLYGTTVSGGAYQTACGGHACGAVFELSPNGNGAWTETVLHSFGSGNDGREPLAGLIFDADGNLYGTTYSGGVQGSGTVFELTPGANGTWAETVLHSFCSARQCADGGGPLAGVILDAAGSLYGTTVLGGSRTKLCGNRGCGVVFQLKRSANGAWAHKTLHSFDGSDGNQPQASLIFDTTGNLYGTTVAGGSTRSGTVFELFPAKNGKWTEKVLGGKGLGSTASVIFDSAGNLYGTSGSGGYGDGAVLKLTPGKSGEWRQELLYKFPKNGQDGFQADANLIFDTTGNLYSTTNRGGASGSGCGGYGCGTVFEITP
jgi:uncharacterized repeat protein (TIGR03803 family)